MAVTSTAVAAQVAVLFVMLMGTTIDATTTTHGQYNISFDWSVYCPNAYDGEALAQVTVYGRIESSKNTYRVESDSHTLYYDNDSMTQHFEVSIPRPDATKPYEFWFTWSSLPRQNLFAYIENQHCCWSVTSPMIIGEETNNTCIEEGQLTLPHHVSLCYYIEQPLLVPDDDQSGRLWVCLHPVGIVLNGGQPELIKSSEFWSCSLRINHQCESEVDVMKAPFNFTTDSEETGDEIPPSVIIPLPLSSGPLSTVPSSSVQSSIVLMPSSIVPFTSVSMPLSTVPSSIVPSSIVPSSSVPFSVLRSPLLPPSSINRPPRPFSSPPSASSVSLPTSVPSVEVICLREGVWPLSPAGTNVTLSTGVRECFKGTVNATRYCHADGQWDDEIICESSPSFKKNYNKIKESPAEGLDTLREEFPSVTLPQSVLLLSVALDTALEGRNTSREAFTKSFLKFSDAFISGSKDERDKDTRRSSGSQLLQTLDRFALDYASTDELQESSQLSLKIVEVQRNDVPSNGIKGFEDDQENYISLPKNIFAEDSKVRVASFFFPNLSHLLPPNDKYSSIVSPIISATIDCDSCPVTDLTENVTVQLEIQGSVSMKGTLSCVFYDFISQDDLLPSGDWNTSGCTTSVDGDLVTCSCNHLTHFAILLSPGGPDIDPTDRKFLNTIGLVLVPISLLCMVLVILTYTLIRSLWSIRNYIHIMLCASLFMAQLVFIIGVDKIENQGACSAVAVILLYLFLVTFMWMLMEGVVLYVTLVKVIIYNHKYYVISFTLISYLIPAVYMIPVTLIGYMVNTDDIPDHTHFLYYINETELTACWLNYSTGFIWSFVAPVIVIIMVNIGFFIMAIIIMRNHTKKHKDRQNSAKFRHWLQVTISLTVVMGIAWLVGLLAFTGKLLPVLYIITIFIAAQGIIIFIILVPLSKQVREVFTKYYETKRPQSSLLSKLSVKSSSISNGKHGSMWEDSSKGDASTDVTSRHKPLLDSKDRAIINPVYDIAQSPAGLNHADSSSQIRLIENEESAKIANEIDKEGFVKTHPKPQEYELPMSTLKNQNQYETVDQNQYEAVDRNQYVDQNQYETIPVSMGTMSTFK